MASTKNLSLRNRSVLFLFVVVVLAMVNSAMSTVCDHEDMSCTDIGEHYSKTRSDGRKLLQNTVAANQNPAPTLSNRRSLLAPFCSETDASAAGVIKCTNAMRANAGAFKSEFRCSTEWLASFQPSQGLIESRALAVAAELHSKDMAARGQLDHTGTGGTSVGDRVRKQGYEWNSVSENIAFGYTTAKDVVLGWMCSSGHRRGILSCNTIEIGVGIATGRNGRKYHTQDFGCPRGSRCSCSGPGSTPEAGSTGSQEREEPSGGATEEPREMTPKEGPFEPRERPMEPKEPMGEEGEGQGPFGGEGSSSTPFEDPRRSQDSRNRRFRFGNGGFYFYPGHRGSNKRRQGTPSSSFGGNNNEGGRFVFFPGQQQRSESDQNPSGPGESKRDQDSSEGRFGGFNFFG